MNKITDNGSPKNNSVYKIHHPPSGLNVFPEINTTICEPIIKKGNFDKSIKILGTSFLFSIIILKTINKNDNIKAIAVNHNSASNNSLHGEIKKDAVIHSNNIDIYGINDFFKLFLIIMGPQDL